MTDEQTVHTEIERKWIVDPVIAKTLISFATESFDIEQGYFGDMCRCRINRGSVEDAVLSVKITTSPLTRLEFNYPIPLQEADAILTQIDSLSKRRYDIGDGFILDKFSGRLEGFYLIEKEYTTEQLARADSPPDHWNAEDVTEDSRYKNAELLHLTWDDTLGLYKEDAVTAAFVSDIDIESLIVTGDVEDVMPDEIKIPNG